jgi:RNA polymerase sigma-70 factor, ECF subfamily
VQVLLKIFVLDTPTFITLIKERPEQALKSLYDDYYEMLCYQVYLMLKDKVVAEDIVQEVFMGIWKKREEVNIQTSLVGYLKRACRNRTLNYIRDNAVRWEDDSALDNRSAEGYDTEGILELEDLSTRIQKEIANLPEKCCIIFNLSRFEEMTYNEIATHLDISVKTVENQISKALKILRQRIYTNVV